MSIEPMDAEEVGVLSRRSKYLGDFKNETDAVLKLELNTGVKFPCRWEHNAQKQCRGIIAIRIAARRRDMKITASCREGIIYIVRTK